MIRALRFFAIAFVAIAAHAATDASFIVSTTADDGAGSLRQAIADANAQCSGVCPIGFRIPPSELVDGVATIRLATPLPDLAVDAPIDGSSEQTFLGLSDVEHPLVMLDGSAMKEGGAFTFTAKSNSIAAIAIGNFPGAAITLMPQPQPGIGSIAVQSCYIGTDAAGLVAMPNERGIIATGTSSLSLNVISGNRHSAIWMQGGHASSVRACLIGVAADGSPMSNGSSGIYIGPGSLEPRIEGNTIANNREFGIAIHPSVQRVLAAHNVIRDNGLFGIDYGLDLATPNVAIDIGRAPNTPLLTSARYDAVKNRTIVEGDLFTSYDRSNRFSVVFYSNRSDVNAQAEKEEGEAIVSGSGHFTAELPGDLRGRFLTAVTVRGFRFVPDEGYAITEDTSEICAPIPVTQ